MTDARMRELAEKLENAPELLTWTSVAGGSFIYITPQERDEIVQAISAMSRAREEALEDAAKVAEDRAHDNEAPHMRIRLGIAKAIRALAKGEDRPTGREADDMPTRVRKLIDDFTAKKIAEGPEACRRYLIGLGIYDEAALTPPIGGTSSLSTDTGGK